MANSQKHTAMKSAAAETQSTSIVVKDIKTGIIIDTTKSEMPHKSVEDQIGWYVGKMVWNKTIKPDTDVLVEFGFGRDREFYRFKGNENTYTVEYLTDAQTWKYLFTSHDVNRIAVKMDAYDTDNIFHNQGDEIDDDTVLEIRVYINQYDFYRFMEQPSGYYRLSYFGTSNYGVSGSDLERDAKLMKALLK